MPGMDGYQVARRVRAMVGANELLLIAATGWGQKSDRQAALDAGFDAHLVKPVDQLELRGLIEGWRQRRAAS
jgi:CheY-like chemotaxis protein